MKSRSLGRSGRTCRGYSGRILGSPKQPHNFFCHFNEWNWLHFSPTVFRKKLAQSKSILKQQSTKKYQITKNCAQNTSSKTCYRVSDLVINILAVLFFLYILVLKFYSGISWGEIVKYKISLKQQTIREHKFQIMKPEYQILYHKFLICFSPLENNIC